MGRHPTWGIASPPLAAHSAAAKRPLIKGTCCTTRKSNRFIICRKRNGTYCFWLKISEEIRKKEMDIRISHCLGRWFSDSEENVIITLLTPVYLYIPK
ncbi:hypothetical protein CDAR_90741 [Caerostris darwini]|uniref:Uncharacterized protein n=1 Tax=Caerostris darwini TaxID=1538125 RepID=A0AAV4RT98_9ARAC|nr:hypothetical protein CDAR_90741 [Caerostris darwini]